MNLKRAAVFVAILVAAWLLLRDKGAAPPSSGSPESSKSDAGRLADADLVKTISHGETVKIEEHLREGSWTVVEFEADW